VHNTDKFAFIMLYNSSFG